MVVSGTDENQTVHVGESEQPALYRMPSDPFAAIELPSGARIHALLDVSQYSSGASSACTLMTIETALRICVLARLPDENELAESVKAASAYDLNIHLAADDVLEQCPRYSQLLHVADKEDGQMFTEFDVLLTKMEDLCKGGDHQAAAAVVTKSPETLLTACVPNLETGGVEWGIFDSHHRLHAQGGHVIWFPDMSSLIMYINALWPMPNIPGLDEGQAFMLHNFDASVLALRTDGTYDANAAEAIVRSPIDVAALKLAMALRELEKLREENITLRKDKSKLEEDASFERRMRWQSEGRRSGRRREDEDGGDCSIS